MFAFTKANLEHEMIRGVKLSGVKRIRVHDIRHSHASLLISELNAPPLLVAERLGHEKITTTLQTYSHLYPNQSRELAEKLNQVYLKKERIKMPGIHKDPTMSFRPSEWQRAEIEARIKLSGHLKKDFITRACIYANIVVVGKKENVDKIVKAVQTMQQEKKQIAGQFLIGTDLISSDELEQQKRDYLALVIAVVDILNGASYLFKEDKIND